MELMQCDNGSIRISAWLAKKKEEEKKGTLEIENTYSKKRTVFMKKWKYGKPEMDYKGLKKSLCCSSMVYVYILLLPVTMCPVNPVNQ